MTAGAWSGTRGRSAVFVFVLVALCLAAAAWIQPFLGLVLFAAGAGLFYRTFQPLWAAALTASVATFVNNEGGHLTRDESVVVMLVLYTLLSVLVQWRFGKWRLPRSPMLVPILLWLATSTFAAVHGVVVGNSFRYLGLEFLPPLMAALALLVGGCEVTDDELRAVCRLWAVVALAHVGLGIWSYHVNHIRAGGIWYTPAPGMIAVLSLGLALMARSAAGRAGWLLLLCACLLHQLLSFSRGYWLGLMVALPLVVVLFVARGEGAAERWKMVWRLAPVALVVVTVAFVGIGLAYGWTDIAGLVLTRFMSTSSTKWSSESASNFARILEWAVAFKHFLKAPILGGGLGMEMQVRYPIYGRTGHQSFMHEVYLYILVKQGIIGLAAFLNMLFAAVLLGVRGALDSTRNDRAWLMTCAGVTVYLSVVDLTSYHMMEVNAPTLAAVLWGIAIARTRTGFVSVRFMPRSRAAAAVR